MDKESQGTTKELGPRLGCERCFGTLDPTKPIPERNRFAQCGNCGSLYHVGCVPQRCIGCDGVEFESAEVKPPVHLEPKRALPVLLKPGPLNTLKDYPLGVSAGIAYLDRREPTTLMVVNNSEATVELKRTIGPPWALVHLGLSDGNDDESIRLEPGDECEIEVHPHFLRPDWGLSFVPLHGGRGFEVRTQEESPTYLAGLLLFLSALLYHLSTLRSHGGGLDSAGTLFVAAGGALVLGSLELVAPSWMLALRFQLLRLARVVDVLFPGWRPIERYRRKLWERVDDGHYAMRMKDGALAFVSVLRVVIVGYVLALPIAYGLRAGLGELAGWFLVLLFLAYALVVTVGAHVLLKGYGIDIPEWLSRRSGFMFKLRTAAEWLRDRAAGVLSRRRRR